MRFRISDGKNVVCSVAVITLCRFRISELRNLSVVCVKVGGGDLLVTPAALCHDIQFEPFDVGPPNGMGRVTVVADGELLVRLMHHGRMDALHKLLLYSMMASTACGRDVLLIDA